MAPHYVDTFSCSGTNPWMSAVSLCVSVPEHQRAPWESPIFKNLIFLFDCCRWELILHQVPMWAPSTWHEEPPSGKSHLVLWSLLHSVRSYNVYPTSTYWARDVEYSQTLEKTYFSHIGNIVDLRCLLVEKPTKTKQTKQRYCPAEPVIRMAGYSSLLLGWNKSW